MHKAILYITLLGTILLLGSCSIRTWSDFDKNVEKGNYDTFKMYLYDNAVEFGTSPINKIRIENAVKVNLNSMGLMRDENPDLLVKYFVKLNKKEFIETCNNVYNDFEGGEYCIERIVYYDEGTLVIDIIDAHEDRIIWHGVAEGAPLHKLKDPDKKIKTIVQKLMLEFEIYRAEYLK